MVAVMKHLAVVAGGEEEPEQVYEAEHGTQADEAGLGGGARGSYYSPLTASAAWPCAV